MELRLATFNIRNGRALDGRHLWWLRRPATAAVLAGLAADVVGLQEVYGFQLRWLLRRLGGRGYRHVGVGRDDGAGRGERVPVLYRSDRFLLERTETRWLSDTPHVPGSRSWGNRLPRIVTLAWLVERASGERLGVANVHLDHASAPARLAASRAVVGWLRLEDDRPWVILGDLNATPAEGSVDEFLDAGWRDVLGGLAATGPGAGTEHGFSGRDDGRRIDVVLVPSGWRVLEARIVTDRPGGRLASDHWPVSARVADR